MKARPAQGYAPCRRRRRVSPLPPAAQDSTASLSGEDLNPKRRARALGASELDKLLPASVHQSIPSTPADIAAKRQELVESPTSKTLVKDFMRRLKEFERHGPRGAFSQARRFALEMLGSPAAIPGKVFWRVCMEVADLAKRENRVEEVCVPPQRRHTGLHALEGQAGMHSKGGVCPPPPPPGRPAYDPATVP